MEAERKHKTISRNQMDILDPVVRVLKEAGVPIRYLDERESITTIHRAVAIGRANYSYENGGDINAVDAFGLTPIHYSVLLPCCGNDSVIFKNLVKLGANLDITAGDRFGNYTPLHLAASKGDDRFLLLLVEAGADVNILSGHHGAAINIACRKQALTAMEILLVNGRADVNTRDSNGCSSLHELCLNCIALHEEENYRFQFFEMLDNSINVVDVMAVDDCGRTPLHCAASVGNISALRFLLGKNRERVDVNALDKQGRTPLHYAACGIILAKNCSTIQKLVMAGASPMIADSFGLRPVEYIELLKKQDRHCCDEDVFIDAMNFLRTT